MSYVLDSHGMGAGLSLGSPQDPVPHTKGNTYPCFLWASSALLPTATWTGDVSQHCLHSMIPSCVAEEVSPLLSPFLALLPCCTLLLPVHPARADGCWELVPLQDYPRLECSQDGLGSSYAQVSGTHSTSPIPSCSCRPSTSHGEGRTMASQPGSSGRESMLGETGMEVQEVGKPHGLGS